MVGPQYKHLGILCKIGFLTVMCFLVLLSPRVAADSNCVDGTTIPPAVLNNGSTAIDSFCQPHGGTAAGSTVIERSTDEDTCKGQDFKTCVKQGSIVSKFLLPAINFLSAGVGIVVTIMLIIGGIQYSAAGGDPQAVTSAKNKITNALIALLAFIFLWSFLQWIVPGGVFT